jgi:hypothetical protein
MLRSSSADGVVVRQAVARTVVTGVLQIEVTVRVECDFSAQVTTQLDAGVGARDVVETRTIQGADLHVFDRFGLHGEIGCLRSAHGDKTRR